MKVATPETLTVPVPSKVPAPHAFGTLGCNVSLRAALVRPRDVRAPVLERRSGSVVAEQKLTVPVGVPVGTGEIVAVNVTAAPTAAGFGEPVRLVVVVVAAAGLIVSVSVLEVDIANPVLQEYTAVMLCAATFRLLVMNTARPDAFRFTAPSKVAPSEKLTVPSEDPVGTGLTAAVNVTAAPTVAGFGEPVRLVVVRVAAAGLIVSVSVLEVDVANPVLPEYTAVMLCAATVRLLVMKTAMPDALRFTVPSKVAPSEKLTVPSEDPVGTGLTAAVKVTAAPTVAGFGEPVSDVVVVVAAAGLIVSVRALEVDVANPVLPEYTAVMLYAAAVRLLVMKVATPETLTVPVPSKVPAPHAFGTLGCNVSLRAALVRPRDVRAPALERRSGSVVAEQK